jgi:hypothetical protein
LEDHIVRLLFNLIYISPSFCIEANNDTVEKSVRLRIIDMDDIDEDTPQTGKHLSSLY